MMVAAQVWILAMALLLVAILLDPETASQLTDRLSTTP